MVKLAEFGLIMKGINITASFNYEHRQNRCIENRKSRTSIGAHIHMNHDN